MLDEFERHIGFYNMRFPASPSEANDVSIENIIEKMVPFFDSGGAYWLHEKNTASLRLIDLDVDSFDGFIVLLISNSNTRIADPSFEHIVSGDSRTANKGDGEGVASSAHLLISKSKSPTSGLYKAALEKVPSIGSTVIAAFLRSVLKEAFDTYSPRPVFTYNGTERVYRPLVDIVGDFSEKLAAQISRGQLVGVELIDHRNEQQGLDEDGVFIEKRRSVELGLSGDIDADTVRSAIDKLRVRYRAQGYDQMKVRLKFEEEGQQTIPVRLDIDQEATETLAVRKEVVKTEERLGQRHEKICKELVEGMIGILS